MESDGGISIFYSYSHRDERFCQTLKAHLSVLERKGIISSWYDRKINPGQQWEREIDENVRKSDIILLFVSADFVASDYCYQEELTIAMERHEANQAIVIPVIVRPVDFSDAPFSKIQALPKDAQPVSKWDDEDEAWLDVVKGIKKAIGEVQSMKTRSGDDKGFIGINEYLHSELNSLEQAFFAEESQSTHRGLATGLHELDRITDGLHKSDLFVIAGRPGMGKTDLALRIACNVAISEKKAVGYFSLNLPVDRLTRKMISSLGKLPSFRLFKGDMYEADWSRLTAAVGILKDLPLYIDDHISLSVEQLRERAIKLKFEKDVQLIIIDSLQHLDSAANNVARQEATRFLSRLARELCIPIVVTTTISRDIESRPNKRPVISDLGSWGSLEEDSNTLVFIYRDEVYNSDTSDYGLAELIVAKNSSVGPVGTVMVSYFADTCSFENISGV